MDAIAIILALLAASLVFAAWQARRIRNDPRDVALLATTAGLLGVASAVTAGA